MTSSWDKASSLPRACLRSWAMASEDLHSQFVALLTGLRSARVLTPLSSSTLCPLSSPCKLALPGRVFLTKESGSHRPSVAPPGSLFGPFAPFPPARAFFACHTQIHTAVTLRAKTPSRAALRNIVAARLARTHCVRRRSSSHLVALLLPPSPAQGYCMAGVCSQGRGARTFLHSLDWRRRARPRADGGQSSAPRKLSLYRSSRRSDQPTSLSRND